MLQQLSVPRGSRCLSCLSSLWPGERRLCWGYRLRARHTGSGQPGWPCPWLPAHDSSVPRQLEECPWKQWGILMPGDPNWRICVLWKNTSTPSTAMGRDLSIVRRGNPSTLPMALHFLLQREHVVKSDGESYT